MRKHVSPVVVPDPPSGSSFRAPMFVKSGQPWERRVRTSMVARHGIILGSVESPRCSSITAPTESRGDNLSRHLTPAVGTAGEGLNQQQPPGDEGGHRAAQEGNRHDAPQSFGPREADAELDPKL